MTFHCLLTSLVYNGKSATIVLSHSMHCVIFSLATFKILFLSLAFSILTVRGLRVVFFVFILLGAHWASDNSICFPPNLRHFWPLFLQLFFPLLFFLLEFQLLTSYRYIYDILPQVTKALFLFVFVSLNYF